MIDSVRSRLLALPGMILSVLTVMVLLAPAAWQRYGRLLGWTPVANLESAETVALQSARQVFPDAATLLPTRHGRQIIDHNGNTLGYVVSSHPYAPEMQGFGGPLEMVIYADPNNDICQIQLGKNSEDVAYLDKINRSGLLQSWNMLPLAAQSGYLRVDAISGATYTSTAMINAVSATLQGVTDELPATTGATPITLRHRVAPYLGLLCLGFALVLAWRRRCHPRLRQLQLLLNVVILGGVCGVFLSLSNFLSRLAAGSLAGSNALIGGLLLAALLMPLFTGRPFYCYHLCPLGSAQELLGSLCSKKITLSSRWQRAAQWSRNSIVFMLLLLWASGVGLNLVRYELFSALVWGTIDYPLLAATALAGAAALVVQRPYCRFVCPTGWLIAYCDSRQISTSTKSKSA